MGYFGKDRCALMLTRRDHLAAAVVSGRRRSRRSRSAASTCCTACARKQESHVLREHDRQRDRRSRSARGSASTIDTDRDAAATKSELRLPVQDNQYDIIFLMERARRIGYDLFVEGEAQNGGRRARCSISARRATCARSPIGLTYGRSLIEFQPELTTANQVGKVTVRGWDRSRRRRSSTTATRGEIATKGVGAKGGQAAIDKSFRPAQEIIADQARSRARRKPRRWPTRPSSGIAKDMVKGTGSVVGLPDLRAGSVLQIDGLRRRASAAATSSRRPPTRSATAATPRSSSAAARN